MNTLGVPEMEFRERISLPDRRKQVIVNVYHMGPFGKRKYSVGYGFDKADDIREVFMWPETSGAELDAILSDSCIGISHALQRGATVSDFVKSFGQLRPEGAPPDENYPPASPLGTIMRIGVLVEALEKRESQ